MGERPDRSGDPRVAAADGGFQLESQIMLAEYSGLRAEIDRRANAQWNVFALQIGSVGIIASLAISKASNFALLLLIPLSSCMLGSRYILHYYHLKLITRYIRDSLSGRLRDELQWEGWKRHQMKEDAEHDPWFTVTGWNVLHPTRLAFEGVASFALVAAAIGVAYDWRLSSPQWYLILGFALLWALGALATFFLHSSFNRSSNP